MALLSCLCSCRHLFGGLTNKSLCELVAGIVPGYSARQMTYELTDHGRKIAVFFTKTYARILNPSLPELDPALPDEIVQRSPLAQVSRAVEHALDARIAGAQLTA
jgi:hypothetical protein